MNIQITEEILNKISKEYGEAFYLLDSKQFASNYLELKDAFSSVYSRFNIAYSYKTNYIPKLLKQVKMFGGYAEVVSEMELELALKVGVDYGNVIWNGPIKNNETLKNYLLNGGLVNIDSLNELETVKETVESFPEKKFRLGLRCNFDIGDETVSRFGIDVSSEEFRTAADYIKSSRNVVPACLQCHFADRNLKYWKPRAQHMIEVIDSIGIMPEMVDLGGGIFGKMDDSLKCQLSSYVPDYKEYAETAAVLFKEKYGDKGPELVIEPGTALVGDCLSFIGRIKSVKKVRDRYFANALMSQKNISMGGVKPPVEIISCGNKQKYYESIDIAGYTCIENDVIYSGYSGKLAVGDYLAVGNCGSYSIVMKPPFILPNFAILEINEENIEVIKRQETFEDIFGSYNFEV